VRSCRVSNGTASPCSHSLFSDFSARQTLQTEPTRAKVMLSKKPVKNCNTSIHGLSAELPSSGVDPASFSEGERGRCAASQSTSPPPSLPPVVLPDLFARAEPKPLIKLAFKKLNKEVESLRKNKESLYGPFGLSVFFSSYSPLFLLLQFSSFNVFSSSWFSALYFFKMLPTRCSSFPTDL